MPLPLPTFTTDDVRAFPDDGQRYELLLREPVEIDLAFLFRDIP